MVKAQPPWGKLTSHWAWATPPHKTPMKTKYISIYIYIYIYIKIYYYYFVISVYIFVINTKEFFSQKTISHIIILNR